MSSLWLLMLLLLSLLLLALLVLHSSLVSSLDGLRQRANRNGRFFAVSFCFLLFVFPALFSFSQLRRGSDAHTQRSATQSLSGGQSAGGVRPLIGVCLPQAAGGGAGGRCRQDQRRGVLAPAQPIAAALRLSDRPLAARLQWKSIGPHFGRAMGESSAGTAEDGDESATTQSQRRPLLPLRQSDPLVDRSTRRGPVRDCTLSAASL